MCDQLQCRGAVINTCSQFPQEPAEIHSSITGQEIAEALKAQHGVELDKRKVELTEPVRTVGQTTIVLKLSAGVSTRMIMNVVAAEK